MTAVFDLAVRYQEPGADEPALIPVNDLDELAVSIRLLRDRGIKGEPVRAVWTPDAELQARVERDLTREAVLSIAQRYWEEEISKSTALAELEPHSSLPPDALAEKLEDLCSELNYQEGVENDWIAPGPGKDKQDLEEVAACLIRTAVDDLIGTTTTSGTSSPASSPVAEAKGGTN